jgi:hypothetical protein
MKVVINGCYGGFGLSKEAYEFLNIGYRESTGFCHPDNFDIRVDSKDFRSSENLIKCVESLGEKANGRCASLEIIEIPDDVTDWYIDEYDGMETIREGRSWN